MNHTSLSLAGLKWCIQNTLTAGTISTGKKETPSEKAVLTMVHDRPRACSKDMNSPPQKAASRTVLTAELEELELKADDGHTAACPCQAASTNLMGADKSDCVPPHDSSQGKAHLLVQGVSQEEIK